MNDLIGLLSFICPACFSNIAEKKRRHLQMTDYAYYNREIPEYYDKMYLDGYNLADIIIACTQKIVNNSYLKQEVNSIKITSEIKTK